MFREIITLNTDSMPESCDRRNQLLKSVRYYWTTYIGFFRLTVAGTLTTLRIL